jgi:glycosyltransferase involved in cell wall biosynthesis
MDFIQMSRQLINKPVLSVVIPVYREGSHLRMVLTTIQKTLDSLDMSYELIVVDDGSPDDTWSVLTDYSEKFPLLRALRLSRNFGKESALCAGLEMSRGTAVIVMDGDLQHPPEFIPKMVRIWSESDADVIEAVKEHRGKESLINKIGAKAFYTILNKLSGYYLTGASDFKLMDRKVVDAWLRMREGNLFFRGMIAWLGFKRVQLPFVVAERVDGQSRWAVLRLVKLAMTAVTAFSSVLLQFVTLSGFIFSLFALILGCQTLYLKAKGVAIDGFTTVILLLLIIGSLLMFSLGIIGTYISRIYDEVKGRPRYIVAQTIDRISGVSSILLSEDKSETLLKEAQK